MENFGSVKKRLSYEEDQRSERSLKEAHDVRVLGSSLRRPTGQSFNPRDGHLEMDRQSEISVNQIQREQHDHLGNSPFHQPRMAADARPDLGQMRSNSRMQPSQTIPSSERASKGSRQRVINFSYEGNLWSRPYMSNEWRVLYFFWLLVAYVVSYGRFLIDELAVNRNGLGEVWAKHVKYLGEIGAKDRQKSVYEYYPKTEVLRRFVKWEETLRLSVYFYVLRIAKRSMLGASTSALTIWFAEPFVLFLVLWLCAGALW